MTLHTQSGRNRGCWVMPCDEMSQQPVELALTIIVSSLQPERSSMLPQVRPPFVDIA